MLDKENRQKLREQLRGTIEKASSKVTTEVKAEQGDFKIVLSSTNIDHFYRGQNVASVKVSELDDEIVNFIEQDPQTVCAVMLTEFINGFNTEAFEKTAAHATQSAETYQRITEKQIDNQKLPLHPRPEEGHPYRNITEKQMPEHDERHGSYNVITQGQMRDEKTTFKGEPMTATKRQDEDRTIITEGQFDSEDQQGSVDRGTTGSEFQGYQGHMITDKQIQELISHHGWDEPRTITEGQDQLAQQKGELGRLTAEAASKMLKEAYGVLGTTVVALGVTPDEVFDVVKSLTSHSNKAQALSDILANKQDVLDVKTAIKRRRYHGKIASANETPETIASAVLRQICNLDGDGRHKSSALFFIASDDSPAKIAEAAEAVLSAKEEEKESLDPNDPKSIFAVALDQTEKPKIEGDASDGLYQYSGSVSEIDGDPADKEKFAEKAFEHCKTIVAQNAPGEVKESNLTPVSIDVDQDKGTFDLILKDASNVDPEALKARAEKRRELAKEADGEASTKEAATKEAQVPVGGMPPAGGPEMAQPAPPAAGADMAAAPVESLGGGEPPVPPGPEGAGGEPKPPASVCPVCGSEDVDVDNGEVRCNNCGAEGSVSVRFEITKWPGTIEESEAEGVEEPSEGFELGGVEEEAGLGGPGEAGLEGTVPPNVPIAASINIKPNTLEKLAEQKIKLGSICPNCGSNNCDLLEGKGICYACNTEYDVSLLTQKGKTYKLAARFEWIPTSNDVGECEDCNRLKVAFRKALDDYGISFSEFHSLDYKGKGQTILKMAKTGVLENVYKEYDENLPIEKIAAAMPTRWQGYENVDEFPMQSCLEWLNRRFGENGSAMAGPCQGKKLAECVCGQLRDLGIYADGLAAKVAKTHLSNDPIEQFPTEECIGTMKNEGFRLKEAGIICDCLKAAYASQEDLLIEAVTNHIPDKQAFGAIVERETGTAVTPRPMPARPRPMPARPRPMPARPRPMPARDEVIEDEVVDEVPEDISEVPMELDVTEEAEIGEAPDLEIEEIVEGPVEPELAPEIGGEEMVDITLTLDRDTAEEIYQAIEDAIQAPVGEVLPEEGPLEDVNEVMEPEEQVIEPEVEEVAEPVEEEVPGELEHGEELATGGEMAKEGDEEEKECAAPAKACVQPEKKKEPAPKERQEETRVETKQAATDEDQEPKEEDSVAGYVDRIMGEEKVNEVMKDVPDEEKDDVMNALRQRKAAELDEVLLKMKTGTITKESTGVGNLIDALIKKAQEEPDKFHYIAEKGVKTVERPTQDSVEFKYQSGGKIGHEDKFSADDPKVPRKKQLLGTEGQDMGVNDTGDMPNIPAGSAAMRGEQHYRPEKQEEVDPNQGNIATTASSQPELKEKKSSTEEEIKMAEKEVKYKVSSGHKMYDGLKKVLAAGQTKIKCNDGSEYDVSVTKDKKSFFLTAKKELPEALKKHMFKKKDEKGEEKEEKEEEGTKKESQTKQLVHVRTNEDDPDINQPSGPGAGKVKADKPHSQAVDEPAPSEGVSEPDVPEAPNKGQLKREETVTNTLEMPEIPAGGGQNPNYDQDEKKAPEKQEDVLGIDPPTTASVEVDIRKEATRIAGEMLTKGKIKPDQLDDQITHLSQLSMPLLKQYEEDLLKKSETNEDAGLEKTANTDAVETALVIPASTRVEGNQELFQTQIQSLMTLAQRNAEHERLSEEKGDLDVFK